MMGWRIAAAFSWDEEADDHDHDHDLLGATKAIEGLKAWTTVVTAVMARKETSLSNFMVILLSLLLLLLLIKWMLAR
jgi:hypothetical protein